jgi:hypothetical protein
MDNKRLVLAEMWFMRTPEHILEDHQINNERTTNLKNNRICRIQKLERTH